MYHKSMPALADVVEDPMERETVPDLQQVEQYDGNSAGP